jgi:hypothetical protein
MIYIGIFKKNRGGFNIQYFKENPERTKTPEDLELIYYEAYKDEKLGLKRFKSLKLYGKAWAQLKLRIFGKDK